MMDQCGRGKGDMLTDVSSSTVGTVTVPSSTITATSVAGFPNTGGDIYLQTHVTSPEGVKHYRVHYTGIRVRTFTGCMWDNISDSSGTVQSGSTILAQFISSGPNTGKQTWPKQALEPCYSWNNVYVPTNTQYGMFVGKQPTTKLGTDFFNLGARPSPTPPGPQTPSEVSSTYVAALNGVNYTGPYTYPHPLIAETQGTPTPTPTASPTATPSATASPPPR
jgi:hypothetical protein